MGKLLKYLKPYLKFVILAPIFMLIEVTSDITQPRLIALIVDNGVANHNSSIVIKMSVLMIVIAMFGLLGGVGCMVCSSIASMNFGADVRSDVFKKTQEFSFSNLDEFKTESLVTRLTNDIVQVQNIVLMSLRMLVRSPLLCIGGIIMAITINANLSIIIIIAIPLLIICVSIIMKKSFPVFDSVQKKLDKVNGVIRENLTGIRVIKAYVRAPFEKSRFNKSNEELIDVTLIANRLTILVTPVMMFIMNMSVVAVLWFGAVQIDKGAMKVGEIMAFINYMVQILNSLLNIALMTINLSRAKVSADRLEEVLESKIDITNLPDCVSTEIKTGAVEFDNVSFTYKDASGDPVLKHISFTVKAGETVAILGATGSGKSTLVNLIPRLYDVSEGKIMIDGIDVRNYNMDTLRKGIAVVLQESILFSGSIRDNIRWGKEDATEDEIVSAAKAAEASNFIMKFTEGYDTQIGQKGVNVSGGQKQRLCIARAIIKKPKILILDDSTSAVDLETEGKIQEAFDSTIKGTTKFIIAQRVSSVLEADKIIVLEDGNISAEGTHEQLLKNSVTYKDICRSQLGEEVLLNV
jgi:ATP-binding cassette subfamily B multidrug efflux pump